MTNIDNEFLIIQATKYLDGLFSNNSTDELDLSCSIDELQHFWSIKDNLNKTFSAINHLYHHSNCVAKYEIVFDENEQVVDEFFVTY